MLSNRVKDCGGLNARGFQECLQKTKQAVLVANEAALDQELRKAGKLAPPMAYDRRNWRHANIEVKETQIYDKAGELPFYLTRGSLRQVADETLKIDFSTIAPCRGKVAIPGIRALAPIIKAERMLSAIAFPIGDPFQPKAPGVKWHLDDGSMRGIALAMNGEETLGAYIGTS